MIVKIRAVTLAALLGISAPPAFADGVDLPLNDASAVRPRHVTVKAVTYRGSDALEVRLTGPYRGPDMDTFAFVPNLDFHDGTIDVDVAGSLLPSALAGARGFIGVAFRIGGESEGFACEGFYIRPTNGRADDQVRRNHSTQYFSNPGFDFDRLRHEAPGRWCVRRSRARRMDPSADRGVGRNRPVLRRRRRATCPDRQRPKTRSRRAWERGIVGRQRHRRTFP